MKILLPTQEPRAQGELMMCILNLRWDLGTALRPSVCTGDSVFPIYMKLLQTVTVPEALAGDTGDNANSIIILCTSPLLLESQKDLYIFTLNRSTS